MWGQFFVIWRTIFCHLGDNFLSSGGQFFDPGGHFFGSEGVKLGSLGVNLVTPGPGGPKGRDLWVGTDFSKKPKVEKNKTLLGKKWPLGGCSGGVPGGVPGGVRRGFRGCPEGVPGVPGVDFSSPRGRRNRSGRDFFVAALQKKNNKE